MRAISLALTALMLLPSTGPIFGQKSRKDLEKQRQKKLAEIAVTRNILKQTRAKKSESVAVLTALNNQLKIRQELLENIGSQLDVLNNEITLKNQEIQGLEVELKSMRNNFSNLMYSGYKTQNSISRLGFLFTSENFNQAVMRMAYLKRMARHLKNELQLIEKKQNEAGLKISELMSIKNEKSLLLDQEERQLRQIQRDLDNRAELVEGLKKKERSLKDQLSEQQKAADALEKAIKKAIEEEIRKAKEEEERRKREEEERRKKATTDKANTAPAPSAKTGTGGAALSSRFNQSRSQLPWPVKSGYISERYGKHPHPTLNDVSTFNNGINISTTEGSIAYSIFEGEVAAIVDVPGMNRSVLIRHGEYFTVYSNITGLMVVKGDILPAGSALGKIATDVNGQTRIHFEIWKGYEKQNPEIWIKK